MNRLLRAYFTGYGLGVILYGLLAIWPTNAQFNGCTTGFCPSTFGSGFAPQVTTGTQFFVAATGNNSNPGTQALPWADLTNVNANAFGANDCVNLNGGDTFGGGTTGIASASLRCVKSYGSGQATISTGNTKECVKAINIPGVTVFNIICTGGGNSTNTTAGISIVNNQAGNTKLAGPTISGVTISGYGGIGLNIQGANGTSGFNGISLVGPITVSNVTGNTSSQSFGIGCIMVYSATGNGSGATTPSHTNLTISGTITISNCTGTNAATVGESGDGIVIGQTCNFSVGANPTDSIVVHDFGGNNGSAAEPIGIYVQDSCNGTVARYEVYNGLGGTNSAYADGVSINNGNINITLEKGKVHDNAGFGALLGNTSVAPLWANNHLRYNLFQNNGFGKPGLSNVGFLFAQAATGTGYVYGNTIVEQRGNIAIGDWVSSTQAYTMVVANNILAVNNNGTLVKIQHPSTHTFTGNDYYTYSAPVNFSWNGVAYTSFASWQTATGQEKISGVNVGLTSNPNVYVPGGLFITSGYVPTQDMASNLQAGSPMIGAGINLTTQYGINPGATDYYGVAISAASLPVGAANGDFTSFAASCSQATTFLALTTGFTKLDNVNYNSWICGSQSDGDIAQMDAAYLLAAPNHAAMLLDVSGRGHNLTEHGTCTFTARVGLTGDGSTCFEDTGWNVNSGPNYTLNSVMTAGYDLTAPHTTSGAPVILGVQNTAGTTETTLVPYGATLGHSYCDANDETGTVTTTVTQAGFMICQRTVSTTDSFYTNQGGANSRTANSVALPNANMFLLAASNYLGSGVTGGFIADQIALAFVGGGGLSVTRTPLRAQSFMQAYGINVY